MFFPLNSPAFLLARLQRALVLLSLILIGIAIQAAVPDELTTGSMGSAGHGLPQGSPCSVTATHPASQTATVPRSATATVPKPATATQAASQTATTAPKSATATASVPRPATATAPRSATVTVPKPASATNSRIGRTYSFTVGAY